MTEVVLSHDEWRTFLSTKALVWSIPFGQPTRDGRLALSRCHQQLRIVSGPLELSFGRERSFTVAALGGCAGFGSGGFWGSGRKWLAAQMISVRCKSISTNLYPK